MHANGPVRVLGGAGTGKTVVAMHRAKYLAEQVFAADTDRLLFTTFTRNLAEDIRTNLTKICPVGVMRRIEVINLDAWVSQFLSKHGYDFEMLADGRQRQEIWPVFEEYRALLSRRRLREFSDAMRDARILLEKKATS